MSFLKNLTHLTKVERTPSSNVSLCSITEARPEIASFPPVSTAQSLQVWFAGEAFWRWRIPYQPGRQVPRLEQESKSPDKNRKLPSWAKAAFLSPPMSCLKMTNPRTAPIEVSGLAKNQSHPAGVVNIRRMRGDENLIKKVKRPMNEEHKKTKHRILALPHSSDSVYSTKVATQKVSPSVTDDKPVLLGKCRFPVTFLSISKKDKSSTSKDRLSEEGEPTSAQNPHPGSWKFGCRMRLPRIGNPPARPSNPMPCPPLTPLTCVINSGLFPSCPHSPICENLFNLWTNSLSPTGRSLASNTKRLSRRNRKFSWANVLKMSFPCPFLERGNLDPK
ncbi:MAG: hypothetical protein JWN25_3654 [Verrucomicrobiales bacterium]|nr:hypothetical protein [Verrucomicrobiales bacterium]